MTIYYNKGTEKYPLDKLNVNWDSITLTDRIDFSECVFRLTPDMIALYGILSADCIGIQSKDKNWRTDGSTAALFVYREKKDVWDTSAGKYVTQNVSRDENYLFIRLTNALTSLPADKSIGLSSMPIPNPAVQQLINQNNPALTAMIEEMLDSIVKVSTPTTNVLNTDKLRVFEEALAKLGGGGNRGGGGNYKPAETEAEKLQARFEFLKAQMTPLEFGAISDLTTLLAEVNNSGFDKALEVALRIIGGNK